MKKELNYVVKTAWQVDTFGHSSITPYLFKEMGYENLIINRVDIRLKKGSNFEFFWNGMFTHLLYEHYSSPGYDFEGYFDPYINKEERAKIFLDLMILKREKYVNQDHITYIWGDDMRFKNPQYQFLMMTQLMDIINSKTSEHGFTLKFSLFSEYFSFLDKKLYPSLPTGHDFFPYVDFYPFDYWSGYYSLRPSFKRKVRKGENLQRALEVLNTFVDLDKNLITESRWLNALFQHHDAITGTHNDVTNKDYMEKAKNHHQICKRLIQKSLCLLMNKKKACENNIFLKKHPLYFEKQKSRYLLYFNNLPWKRREIVEVKVFGTNLQIKNENDEILKTQFVKNEIDTTFSLFFEADFHPMGITLIKIEKVPQQNPNITMEDIKMISANDKHLYFTQDDHSLTYFNSSGEIHKIRQSYHVYPSIPVTMFSNGAYIFRINWGVFFLIGLGVGFVIGTFISLILYKWQNVFYKRVTSALIGIYFSWMIVHFVFSLCPDHLINFVHEKPYTFGLPLGILIALFFNMIGGTLNFFIVFIVGLITLSFTFFANPQWIARPMIQEDIKIKGFSGPIIAEMNQYFPNVHQRTRIFNDKNLVEVSYINFNSKQDLVTRFDLNSKSTSFHTDTNSFGWIERRFNPFKFIQSNFYPITSRIKLEESLYLLSSQSLGITKYFNTLEMMLYKYNDVDDERGLETAIEDQTVGNIKFQFYFSKEGVYRQSLELNNPLIYYDIHPNMINIQDLKKNWYFLDEKVIEIFKEKEVDLEIQMREDRMYLRFTCHKEDGIEIDLNNIFRDKKKKEWMKHSLNLNQSFPTSSNVKLEKIMVFSKRFIPLNM